MWRGMATPDRGLPKTIPRQSRVLSPRYSREPLQRKRCSRNSRPRIDWRPGHRAREPAHIRILTTQRRKRIFINARTRLSLFLSSEIAVLPYCSDKTSCFLVIVYWFFACITPAISYGRGDQTGGTRISSRVLRQMNLFKGGAR